MMQPNVDKLIADAIDLENSIDKTDIGPIWAQTAIAIRLGELHGTMERTNQILEMLATTLAQIHKRLGTNG